MSRLTVLREEIATVLQGITLENGYSFDFGTINQPDEVLVKYPCADITYISETAASDTQASYGYSDVQFALRIKGELLTVGSVPIHQIDDELDQILYAIKKAFLNTNISGNSVLVYKGFTKEKTATGSLFVPSAIILNFTIKYQFQE